MFVSILVQWAGRGIYLIRYTLSHCCGLSLLENDGVLPDEDDDTREIWEMISTQGAYWLTKQTTQTNNQSINMDERRESDKPKVQEVGNSDFNF